MSHVTHGPLNGPLARMRQAATEDLSCLSLMDRDDVSRTLEAHGVQWRDDVFTPMVTLQAFLDQVLDTDGSCRAAVAKVLAWRIGCGQSACSARTGGYCRARQRLPEPALHALVQQVGLRVHEWPACPDARDAPRPAAESRAGRGLPHGVGLLGGRRIKIADGSTVSMPDTPANQQAYPQARTQKPGLGFPIARIAALFDLSTGTVLDAAIGPYKGKQTGENALFRNLLGQVDMHDVVAGDGGFGSFWNFAMMQARGADAIFPLHQCRPEDFRRGKRLGKHDRLVEWRKPSQRPAWMDEQMDQQMPDTLTLRQVRVHIDVPGSRVQALVLVTTLRDPQQYPKAQLAEVYHARWHAELDLRAIKSAMRMDVLRCKTPAMVRKEFWMHLLAYNLVRTIMAQAASHHHGPPRTLSFTGAWQTLRAFAPLASSPQCDALAYTTLLNAIASHRVGHRPNRVEPRAVKRRPKPLPLLKEPRHLARNRLLHPR